MKELVTLNLYSRAIKSSRGNKVAYIEVRAEGRMIEEFESAGESRITILVKRSTLCRVQAMLSSCSIDGWTILDDDRKEIDLIRYIKSIDKK